MKTLREVLLQKKPYGFGTPEPYCFLGALLEEFQVNKKGNAEQGADDQLTAAAK